MLTIDNGHRLINLNQTSDRRFYCRIVETAAQFAEMEPAWRELSAQCSWPSVFKSWDWVSRWWQHFVASDVKMASRRALYIVTVLDYATNELQGIVPLHYDRAAFRFPARPHRLEMFGALGLEQTFNEEPILLLRRDTEMDALQAALNHLYSKECKLAWDFMSLDVNWNIGEDIISKVSFAPGTYYEHTESYGRMVAQIQNGWETYRLSLSKSMKDNIAYYPKRLRKNGLTSQIRYVTDPDALSPAIDLLIQMHSERAHHKSGALHQNHLPGWTQRMMLDDVMRKFALTGDAFVAILSIDEQPAAVQAFLRHDKTILFLYSGFDPALAQYSPLTILAMEVIQKSIREGESIS